MNQIMMWFPVIGTQRRVYVDLIRQLKTRDSEDQSAWDTYSRETRNLAGQISRILTDHLGWPENTVFLPDDPADILFWDRNGDLAGVETIMAVEKAVGKKMCDGFWEKLSTMTFAQVVQKMKDMKAKPRPVPCGR